MKKFYCTYFMVALATVFLQSQKAIDFSVTDINGQQHKLYNDYLNKGKVVVTYLMLTDCPPCHVMAPRFEQLNKTFGSGKGNVQFLLLSISPSDTVKALEHFRDTHQISAPVIGKDGGSLTASLQFINARYGPYQYVPQFSIILPNGTVVYDIVMSRLEERIKDALTARNTMPNKINVGISIPMVKDQLLPSKGNFYFRSAQDLKYERNISELTGGKLSFEYPSASFPEVIEPYITFEYKESTPKGIVTISDVIALRKHVLGLDILTGDARTAADVNNDGRVNLSDVVAMQRVLLGIDATWPDKPSLLMFPSRIPIEITGMAQTIQIQSKLIWTGNLVE